MEKELCLTADIGGTNTRVALFDNKSLLKSSCMTFSNNKYDSFETLIVDYLSSVNVRSVKHAGIAVAGTVETNVAQMTNIAWSFSERSIASVTKAEHVGIINDLQAQGYGLKSLDGSDLEPIIVGSQKSNSDDTKLVCGMGTGFNAAPVFKVGHKIFVPPSEAGHSQISIANQSQQTILEKISSGSSFISVEDILSGRGLEAAGRVLIGNNQTAAQIMESASNGDKNSKKVAEFLATCAGSFLGDLALILLPFGGIYLIGGVSRSLKEYLKSESFIKAFCDKGRFSKFNEKFSIQLVRDDFAALKGCRNFIMQD
jgi:glucokinase